MRFDVGPSQGVPVWSCSALRHPAGYQGSAVYTRYIRADGDASS